MPCGGWGVTLLKLLQSYATLILNEIIIITIIIITMVFDFLIQESLVRLPFQSGLLHLLCAVLQRLWSRLAVWLPTSLSVCLSLTSLTLCCPCRRSVFDMFNFLASKHRQPPEYNPNDEEEEEVQLKSARWVQRSAPCREGETAHTKGLHYEVVMMELDSDLDWWLRKNI